jgi:LacI family transcriptional regulator
MNIGIITNSPTDVFQRNVIAGAVAVAAQNGDDVRIITAGDHRLPELNGLGGLLVIANVLADDLLASLYQSGLPISLVSHHVADLPIPAVAPNNVQGIAILVEHLVVDCHRSRIVFIQGDMNQSDGIQRDTAFRQEIMRYNLDIPPEFFLRGDFVPGVGAASVAQFVAQRRDFDAVLGSDYLMALGAVDALTAAGLRVPEDVSVVGFGDAPEAEMGGLTTVAADVVDLGRRAARQLIGQMRGMKIRGQTLLSAELCERNTSRARATNESGLSRERGG